MADQKGRPKRRKQWRGNTGITATHVTVWTMNHQPLPEDIHDEINDFLKELVERHSTRIMTQIAKV